MRVPGPTNLGRFEGGFASFNPRAQVLAGPGQISAGVGTFLPSPGGLILGRFAFVNMVTGQAFNALADAGIAPPNVGISVPTGGTWQRIYRTCSPLDGRPVRVLRSGLGVTVCRAGEFFLRFPAGAQYGAQVYVNPADGSAVAGPNVTGAVATHWYVAASCELDGLAFVSNWLRFT